MSEWIRLTRIGALLKRVPIDVQVSHIAAMWPGTVIHGEPYTVMIIDGREYCVAETPEEIRPLVGVRE